MVIKKYVCRICKDSGRVFINKDGDVKPMASSNEARRMLRCPECRYGRLNLGDRHWQLKNVIGGK